MKIIVIGLGSMGQRRIRLIKQYNPYIFIAGVDSNTARARDVQKKYNIQIYETIDSAILNNMIDAAFICTSPLSHENIIKKLLQNKINVFTEINLVQNGYDDFIKEKKIKLFLSSTFLYRKDIQWIVHAVEGKNVNYLYHTGQYLPDWHPWENYKDFFVRDIKTNGCREILAIELPWIVKCFGRVRNISVINDRISSLEINYPDNYLIQIEHENGSKGQIAVDIVMRKAVRRLEIYNEDLIIRWDGTPASLQNYNLIKNEFDSVITYNKIERDRRYCENIVENAYMDEIDAFFTWLSGDVSKVLYSFTQDKYILDLIDRIEGVN